MIFRLLIVVIVFAAAAFSQVPIIEPGVSLDLAKWRAARYSNVRYKLNLTLEKMSPVLKGTIEIRVNVSEPEAVATGFLPQIILDWRKIKGSESLSAISNVSVNGQTKNPVATASGSDPTAAATRYEERDEHLIFRVGVVPGENVIKLDFTSPILTSGSAITRYVDKEDGAEYIYSLFVPSDASTAFPVFDQPDLKARFTVTAVTPGDWEFITNETAQAWRGRDVTYFPGPQPPYGDGQGKLSKENQKNGFIVKETKPISTYVFAFAAGPWDRVSSPHVSKGSAGRDEPSLTVGLPTQSSIYVRKSQAAKFKPHAAEVFRLNREAVKYFEQYFDYKFPWPKYDLVLIPEFPFGGMEHAGATFLRESAIIFPQEPTKNDYISRATLIFHETAHQWFGDTVTMRWFDDLWLKEGFATFMAYKAMEKIMPEANAWKIFYERVKQAAYRTDSTKGTTPIYQEINNLSSAKSAYGAIVYNKAPAFLRQAEFYLGEDKFQTAVRAFLKKNEFGNAGWEDLVKEFEVAAGESLKEDFRKVRDQSLQKWAKTWVSQRGLSVFRIVKSQDSSFYILQSSPLGEYGSSHLKFLLGLRFDDKKEGTERVWTFQEERTALTYLYAGGSNIELVFPNVQDYGYGIFLLDDKSRDYVLKNIQNEKDPFLRSMMWGSLWDSVREGELDPREYVELMVKNLNVESDESTIATLLGRTGTALNYYLSEPPVLAGGQDSITNNAKGTKGRVDSVNGRPETRGATPPADAGGSDLRVRVETLLIERMRNAETLGQRITFYRAFLNIALTKNARGVLKQLLTEGVSSPTVREGAPLNPQATLLTRGLLTLRTKDRFDIVTRLLILGDEEAPKLLADLEKTETSDDARRYAYAAKAGIATAENKAKYWQDFTANREISESWIEEAFGPFNSIRHADLTLPYLEQALKELPNHKRNRKIFFVNGWLGAFIGGQRSKAALEIINKFLASNPGLDNDLRLKILENADIIERAVKIRSKFSN